LVKWVVSPLVKKMKKQARAQFEQGKGILKRIGEMEKQTRTQVNQGNAVLEKLEEIDGLIEVIACEIAREKQIKAEALKASTVSLQPHDTGK
jgi:hypothetical protein